MENKKSRPVVAHQGGKEKFLNFIVQHLPGFVQWAAGAVGCCLTWTQAVFWAIRAPGFDFGLFFCGGLLVAAAAVMEMEE